MIKHKTQVHSTECEQEEAARAWAAECWAELNEALIQCPPREIQPMTDLEMWFEHRLESYHF